MTIDSSARRPALQRVKVHSTTHAGLWLDRYLTFQTKMLDRTGKEVPQDDKIQGARAALMHQASVIIKMPQGCRAMASLRLNAALEPRPGYTRGLRIYETRSRMAIGLGQKGSSEVGLRLEHTWGVPCIPGSSLKGLAAAVAHRYTQDEAWDKGKDAGDPKGESHGKLFGQVDQRGLVTFHDGWWCPNSDGEQALAPDIVTVHHKEYYKDGKIAPDGTESPVPSPFLSVPPDRHFAIVLEVEEGNEAWLEAAWTLLDFGLENLGIGGKTNAGYGRLRYDERETTKYKDARENARQKAEEYYAFTHGSLEEQLGIILERAQASLYDALRDTDPGTTSAEDFQSLLPGNLAGSRYTLQTADADAFLKALQHAIRQDKDWYNALRNGKTPAGWHLSAGSKTLRRIGDKLLGQRDAEQEDDVQEPSTERTGDEQALAQRVEDLISAPKAERINLAQEIAEDALTSSETPERVGHEYLATLVTDLAAALKGDRKSAKAFRKHAERLRNRAQQLKAETEE